ncbi:CARDB domain-containing protein [uncultured Tateyamaria sp.]|uniref:CARDB domain-containing protein n=1 Tax=uncultured Tateyamaria sp. TaxID=455651 RepID=UPI002619EFB6|nr:CARDB domain-containing protein [uncultured Tateyamaria sp.]
MSGFFKSVVFACLACLTAGAALAQEAPPRYAAKMVCGTQPDPKVLQLVQGVYGSIVNVLNISGEDQTLIVTLALAHPPPAPLPGGVYSVADISLAPGQAAAVDCDDIAALTFPFGMPDTYIDGFVLIEAEGPLTVQAVYTAAPLIKDGCCHGHPGPVASIDVERIEPVAAQSGPVSRADLLPEPPTLESDPPGQPGTGFCGPRPADGGPPGAVALVRNVGSAAAGASTATFDFGAFGSENRPVPKLEPGEKHEIAAPIPTACFGTANDGTCAFDVIVDSGAVVVETLETNNLRRGYCLRARQ